MPAYFILDIEVHDTALYDAYRKLAPATVTLYGGKYIVRGGKVETCDGGWSPSRIVVVEFPSMEQAHAWLNSPEYAGPRKMRETAANSRVILVEGIPAA